MLKRTRSVAECLSDHAASRGDFPVSSVDIYRRDVVVRRVRIVGCKQPPPKENGRVIKEFSDRSMRALIHKAKNCDADFLSMLTLTYPVEFPMNGGKVKRHLKSFAKAYRETFESRCLWWMEFQRRGAPHFHLLSEEDLAANDGGLVTVERRRKANRGALEFQTNRECANWLAYRWFNIVGSKDPKHLKAGTAWEVVRSEEGAWVYAAAHAGKRKQKKPPEGFENVGRFWGEIGKLNVERIGSVKVTAEDVFDVYGPAALSREGKIKKYLYDAAGKFSFDMPF